jgi:hypothetical protein
MAKYKYFRITVLMPESVHKQVLELAVKEKRPKSAMAAILIEDGLKLAYMCTTYFMGYPIEVVKQPGHLLHKEYKEWVKIAANTKNVQS